MVVSYLQGRAADLKFVESAARSISAAVTEGHKVVVEKSTVPVKAAESISKILKTSSSVKPNASFQVGFSNSMFMNNTVLR